MSRSHGSAGALTFSARELRDLLVAWVALGVAFTLFAEREATDLLTGQPTDLTVGVLTGSLVVSLLTVGVGFLLHELAHKVVAVRFGQVAAFRADYGWLFLAIMGGLVGFLFAAPGAVYHRGPSSPKKNGLIALAGPITNLVLSAVFLVILVGAIVTNTAGLPFDIGWRGLTINLLLAGFNMLPFGPLDGNTVLSWNKIVYGVVAVPSIALGALAIIAF